MYIHSNNIQKLFSFHFLIMCCAKGESRWKKNWLNNFLCSFLRDTPPPRSSSYIHIWKSSLLFYICSLYEQSKGGTFTRTSHTPSLSPSFFLSPPKSAILRRRKVIMMSLIFHFFFTLSVSNTFLLIIMSMHTWNSMVYMFGNYFDIMGDGFFMKWKSQAIFSFIG